VRFNRYNARMPPPPAKPRQRLLWTLLGALLLVGTVPLLISHYFLIGINRDSLETLEKKYLTRSAVSIAADVQNLISGYTRQLQTIVPGILATREFLPRGYGFVDHAEGENLLATWAAADDQIIALRIVDAAGRGTGVQPDGLDNSLVAEMNGAVAIALQGTPYVGNFQYVESLNQPAIVLAVPMESDGRVVGAIEALVSLRKIRDRIVEEGRGDVTAFIVDRSGTVLIHSEPSIGVQRPSYASLGIVREFMKAPVRLTQSYQSLTDGAKPVELLGTVAPVATPDWGVIVQKEQARAFASVTKMVRATVEWSAVAVVLALIFGVFFAAGISRPVRILAERTREIAAGNYQQRVTVRSRNEIGVLAENFNVMSAEIEQAVEKLKQAANENHLLFINSIRMLAAAIDAKDPYTRGHSERVARYSMSIGKYLDLTADQMRHLRISALLHDVGKIGIDDRILRKPGALTEEEFQVMKSHPEKGAAIMGGVPQLRECIPGMKYHHEKWGGGGYPLGLSGEEIPLQARIVTVADTFDAMTTNRPYQKALDLAYVVEKIVSFSNTRFDPRVVQAFVKAVKSGDIQIEEQVRGAA
jgi:HD-GYP domain-containing protein (c-di-GMP phosphodiesterase class II)